MVRIISIPISISIASQEIFVPDHVRAVMCCRNDCKRVMTRTPYISWAPTCHVATSAASAVPRAFFKSFHFPLSTFHPKLTQWIKLTCLHLTLPTRFLVSFKPIYIVTIVQSEASELTMPPLPISAYRGLGKAKAIATCHVCLCYEA